MTVSTIQAALAAHTATCDTLAADLIARGPMTYNRVAERLLRQRMTANGDATNIIACAMRAMRDAQLEPHSDAVRAIALEELAAAQQRIGERLLAAARARNA